MFSGRKINVEDDNLKLHLHLHHHSARKIKLATHRRLLNLIKMAATFVCFTVRHMELELCQWPHMISDCSSITRPNALAVSNLCRAKHHVTPFQTYSYQKSYEKLIAKKTNRIFFPIEYKEKLNYSMEQRKIIKFRKSIKPSIFTP